MKTLNTLIKELQSLVDMDGAIGESPVYVIADHGQMFIKGGNVSIDYTLKYDYYAEPIDEEDFEELDEDELKNVKAFVTIGD